MEQDKIDFFYICDRRACKKCRPECTHTNDINHARNFENINGDLIEQTSIRGFTELPLLLLPPQTPSLTELINKLLKRRNNHE